MIQNLNSGLVLGVAGASTAEGADIVQWTNNGSPDQGWILALQSNGAYLISDVKSGDVIGVSSASISQGAPLVQWPMNGSPDQEWRFTPSGSQLAHNGRQVRIADGDCRQFNQRRRASDSMAGQWIGQSGIYAHPGKLARTSARRSFRIKLFGPDTKERLFSCGLTRHFSPLLRYQALGPLPIAGRDEEIPLQKIVASRLADPEAAVGDGSLTLPSLFLVQGNPLPVLWKVQLFFL